MGLVAFRCRKWREWWRVGRRPVSEKPLDELSAFELLSPAGRRRLEAESKSTDRAERRDGSGAAGDGGVIVASAAAAAVAASCVDGGC